MLRLQHMLGLPVIDSANGRIVGHVRDIAFDEHWALTGVVIRCQGWRLRPAYGTVGWDSVRACGEDGIVIRHRADIRRTPEDRLGRTFQTGAFRLKDLPVLTQDGVQLGRVTDVYFQPDVGTPILGYELTDGFVSDLMEGRKWLRLSAHPDEVTLGEDVILVPAHCGDLLETNVTT